MWVRASSLRAAPGTIQGLIDDFINNTVPKVKAIPGNVGAVLLVDRQQGKCLALTYWKDRAALDGSETAGTGLRTAVATQSGATIEGVQRAETVLMERVGQPQAGVYSRTTQFTAPADRMDAGVAHLRSTVLPKLKGITGFRALICSLNRETGTGVVASVWESLDALKASDAQVAPTREEAIKTFGGSNVSVEIYESAYVDVQAPVTN